jgi:hypothetical protein
MLDKNRSGRRSSSKTEFHTARADELTQTHRYVTLRRKTFSLRLFYGTAQNVALEVLQNSKVCTGTVPRVSAGYKEAARMMACFISLHRYALRESNFLRRVFTADDS